MKIVTVEECASVVEGSVHMQTDNTLLSADQRIGTVILGGECERRTKWLDEDTNVGAEIHSVQSVT